MGKMTEIIRERMKLWQDAGMPDKPEWPKGKYNTDKSKRLMAANDCIGSLGRNKSLILFLEQWEETIKLDTAIGYYLRICLYFLEENQDNLTGPISMKLPEELGLLMSNKTKAFSWPHIQSTCRVLLQDLGNSDEEFNQFDFGYSEDSMDYMVACISNIGYLSSIMGKPDTPSIETVWGNKSPRKAMFEEYLMCLEDMSKCASDGEPRYGWQHLIIAEQYVGMNMHWDDLEEIIDEYKPNQLFKEWLQSIKKS